MVWTILGAGIWGGQEGVDPGLWEGGCGDWLQGAEVEVGRVQRCRVVLYRGAPTLGETGKGSSHSLTSLGIPTAPSPGVRVERPQVKVLPPCPQLVPAPRTSRVW